MIRANQINLHLLSTPEALVPWRAQWNVLAARVPFRGYEWLASWWRAFAVSGSDELAVLAMTSGGELVGLAPWFVRRAGGQRVIRFLGSGEVCSDYLTVLARAGDESEVARAVADWLAAPDDHGRQPQVNWDCLELGGVWEDDRTTGPLVAEMTARGHEVYRQERPSCWRVNLPGSWEDYLAMLSKSHRKQLRRLERVYFDAGRARLHVAHTADDLHNGLATFDRLNARRRASLGQQGCFASPRFASFLDQVAGELLAQGNLRLAWLEVDGQTVSAEYQVLGDGVVYAYQSGIEPQALAHQPGRLITMATLRGAIEEGCHAFDFLRGDEMYKAHWRAVGRPTQDVRLVARSARARLRHRLWLAGARMKSFVKRGLNAAGALG